MRPDSSANCHMLSFPAAHSAILPSYHLHEHAYLVRFPCMLLHRMLTLLAVRCLFLAGSITLTGGGTSKLFPPGCKCDRVPTHSPYRLGLEKIEGGKLCFTVNTVACDSKWKCCNEDLYKFELGVSECGLLMFARLWLVLYACCMKWISAMCMLCLSFGDGWLIGWLAVHSCLIALKCAHIMRSSM